MNTIERTCSQCQTPFSVPVLDIGNGNGEQQITETQKCETCLNPAPAPQEPAQPQENNTNA
jgi:hypothetical protein